MRYDVINEGGGELILSGPHIKSFVQVTAIGEKEEKKVKGVNKHLPLGTGSKIQHPYPGYTGQRNKVAIAWHSHQLQYIGISTTYSLAVFSVFQLIVLMPYSPGTQARR